MVAVASIAPDDLERGRCVQVTSPRANYAAIRRAAVNEHVTARRIVRRDRRRQVVGAGIGHRLLVALDHVAAIDKAMLRRQDHHAATARGKLAGNLELPGHIEIERAVRAWSLLSGAAKDKSIHAAKYATNRTPTPGDRIGQFKGCNG